MTVEQLRQLFPGVTNREFAETLGMTERMFSYIAQGARNDGKIDLGLGYHNMVYVMKRALTEQETVRTVIDQLVSNARFKTIAKNKAIDDLNSERLGIIIYTKKEEE